MKNELKKTNKTKTYENINALKNMSVYSQHAKNEKTKGN